MAVADLISEYHGEWIKFPYDLETIARRFIYMYQIQYQTPKIYTVLPIDTLQGTQVKDGFLKISTIRRRVSLDMSRTTASDFYASVRDRAAAFTTNIIRTNSASTSDNRP